MKRRAKLSDRDSVLDVLRGSEPSSQQDAKTVSAKTLKHQSAKRVDPESIKTSRLQAAKATKRQDVKETEQKAAKLESRQNAKTASQQNDTTGSLFESYLERQEKNEAPVSKKRTERVKLTLYLDPEDLDLLEVEKLRRRRGSARRQGVTDLSALVREAIRKVYSSAKP